MMHRCVIPLPPRAALIFYEEFAESKQQLRCLVQLITALQACVGMDAENYENLCARCTQLSIKMLRKPDQVRCVLLCTRLFWRANVGTINEYRRPKEVLKCLQKALSIVDACMPPQPQLFLHIADGFVYFFDKRVPTITPQQLNELYALCAEQVDSMKDGGDKEAAAAHLRNIVAHVRQQKATAEGATLYAGVTAMG